MNEGQLLLLWPGEVRRKREGDFGQIGPALLAGTNNRPSFINKIPSTSYFWFRDPTFLWVNCGICKQILIFPKIRSVYNCTRKSFGVEEYFYTKV